MGRGGEIRAKRNEKEEDIIVIYDPSWHEAQGRNLTFLNTGLTDCDG